MIGVQIIFLEFNTIDLLNNQFQSHCRAVRPIRYKIPRCRVKITQMVRR